MLLKFKKLESEEKKMKYCTKCVMPDTRPGITFNEEGVCSACQSHEAKKKTNWDARFKELEALCDKYRGMNGASYDCMIAVSGGKDSHFQVNLMKNVMKMNPILVSVEDNFPMTDAGLHNIHNISEEFGCNIISLKPDKKSQKILMRYTFEKYGKPTCVYCIIELRKVAKQKWTLLHVQIGHNCRALYHDSLERCCA